MKFRPNDLPVTESVYGIQDIQQEMIEFCDKRNKEIYSDGKPYYDFSQYYIIEFLMKMIVELEGKVVELEGKVVELENRLRKPICISKDTKIK